MLGFVVSLDHEMLHYRQWLASSPGDREFFHSLYDPTYDLIETLSPAACRNIWLIEKEAYTRTCGLANAWQYQLWISNGLCQNSSPEEFALKLHQVFIGEIYLDLTEG